MKPHERTRVVVRPAEFKNRPVRVTHRTIYRPRTARFTEGAGSLPCTADDGHISTRFEKNGGTYAEILGDWIAWNIEGDPAAAARFTGADCTLCTDPAWQIHKDIVPCACRSQFRG